MLKKSKQMKGSMFFSTLLLGLIMTNFSLTSPDFKEQGLIPKEYTCIGLDGSPELKWEKPPENTKSFALCILDPDAPSGNFTHWIIYNIPATTRHLLPSIANSSTLSDGSFQGLNDFGFIGYGGPCPPKDQKHTYIFTLYALDSILSLQSGTSYSQLQAAMKGHILGEAKLTGFFEK